MQSVFLLRSMIITSSSRNHRDEAYALENTIIDIFYCCIACWSSDLLFSPPNFIIVSKCVNPCLNQGCVEVIGKVLAGVFTSKTQEHLIFQLENRENEDSWYFPEAISSLAKSKSCRMNVDNSRSIAQQLAEVFIYGYLTFSWKHFLSYFPAINSPKPFQRNICTYFNRTCYHAFRSTDGAGKESH